MAISLLRTSEASSEDKAQHVETGPNLSCLPQAVKRSLSLETRELKPDASDIQRTQPEASACAASRRAETPHLCLWCKLQKRPRDRDCILTRQPHTTPSAVSRHPSRASWPRAVRRGGCARRRRHVTRPVRRRLPRDVCAAPDWWVARRRPPVCV